MYVQYIFYINENTKVLNFLSQSDYSHPLK